ncbi:MlaA family lipoprotein [Massilia horti]|uniref:VacJ family lipoprotein n=1 Tax=Massilia horti TaxID=2562153 RepID=A0A4Y9SNM1_9BURK|nr:VacJ family lipoprotein [Massilia horti]TFW28300.1 VacJ family lipoprotein [Massilia horti]
MTGSITKAARRGRGLAVAVAAGLLLAGCATPQNPKDPFEPFNRTVFTFNDNVDRVALKPVATAYKDHVPGFMQTGVNNFFGNLNDLWSAANNFMQLKGQAGMNDLTRFGLNSTFGMLGLLDIASPAGLSKHNEDFGQTLGYWGMPSGPYLMLPILGPSTVRDTAALPADLWADPWSEANPTRLRNTGIGVRAVDQRATILDASNLLEEAALDRYEFIRDGYLQRRESKVYDDDRSKRRKPKSKYDADADDDDQDMAQQQPETPASAETPSK